MEHEDAYLMMMEALDGALSDNGHQRLEDHLGRCPACAREWRALQAIDALFRHAPTLSPAAGFTQRTLAQLPHTRYRAGLIGAIYLLLFFSGVLPLALIGWLAALTWPILTEPAFARGFIQAIEQLGQVVGAVLSALWQGMGLLAGILIQQPAFFGGLLLMLGVILLWGGVYSQLAAAQRVEI